MKSSDDLEAQPDRRSFITGGVAVSLLGAAAATLASESPAAAQTPALKAVAGVAPRATKAVARVTFHTGGGRREPNIRDLQDELYQLFRKFGCLACGNKGVDIYLGCDPIAPIGKPDLPGALSGLDQVGF